MENAADLTFTHDLNAHTGSISIEGNILNAEDFLKLSSAFGYPLNHGWELRGQATAVTKWEWKKPARCHMEWQDRLQQSEFDGCRIEPAPENLRR